MRTKRNLGSYWTVQYPTNQGENIEIGNEKTFADLILTMVADTVKYPTGGKVVEKKN